MADFKNIIFSFLEPFSDLPFENPVLIFLLVLLIILFAPLLFNRIKIPHIIGLILAGVLFGPHGLNLLANDKSFELLGNVGILYIMFLAGLDLDMREFRENKYKSITFGFLTFIFPLAIGFPICHYVLGYEFSASLLTSAMFSTHTLVAYPIVSGMHLSKNKAVTTTVGGTILTDTAVLIILAFVLDGSKGSHDYFWAWMICSFAFFLFFMFIIIPKISRWFFRKFEGEKQSHFIYILSVMFLSAFIAEMVGLEGIIGAFLAGLSLNKYVPHSSALMNRIDFIGNSLFIPFFLISVGMLVDVSILFQGPAAIIIALTLSVVAISGKWIAAWFTQQIFKFTKAQRNLILGLSSSHAAATLAIILAGYHAHILDENVLNGTIILILITCIFASLVTQKSAKKVLKEERSETVTEKATENRILISLSNPQNNQNLVDTAILLKDPIAKESLYALNIIDDHDVSLAQVQKGQELLDDAAKVAAASDNFLRTITRYDIDIASGIIHTIKENQITDVILGTSPHTSSLAFFERISDKIQREFTQNVFILRNKQSINILKRIIVATPPLFEKEEGFLNCYKRIRNLALQLNTKVIFYATSDTTKEVKKLVEKKNTKLSADFRELASWEDFLMIRKIIKSNDLLVIVTSRKNTISYTPLLEKIPYYLSKFFETTDTILIYPKQEKQTDSDNFSNKPHL